MLADCIPLFLGLCLYECGTKEPILMKLSSDAFYQTNLFPLPYHGDLNKCNITFTFNGPGKEVQIIVIKTELLFDEKNNLIKNGTTYETYFTPTYSFKDHYTKKNEISYSSLAQFGYISFEFKDTPRCIMETKTPLFILSEYQTIYIQSDFAFINIPSDSCHWKFATYKGYGFKVVIQYFEPTLISSVEIRNSTDTFVNYRSAKTFHAYYNDDNYLFIDVLKTKNQSIRAFEAYVTIVKKTKKVTNKCKTYPNLEGDVVWNITTTPYVFDVYCFYDFIIVGTNTEYDVTIEKFALERNVDFLKYTYDDVNGQNVTVFVDGNLEDDSGFTLFGYPNGTKRHYFWEYELDGSVPSYGGSVIFKKIKCHCIGKSIFCTANEGNEPTGIMNRNSFRYCGNLRCNFTIEPCYEETGKLSSNLTLMKISIAREHSMITMESDELSDIFTVYSDGVVVLHLELNTFNYLENVYSVFLNSTKNNIFEVITFPSRLSKTLALQTKNTTNNPVAHNVTLTSSTPFAIVDTGLYVYKTVKVEKPEESQPFVIYSSTGYRVPLYKNEDLLINYDTQKCFGAFRPNICNITENQFAIYTGDSYIPYPFLLIQTSNYYQKGCVLNQNIFIAKEKEHFPIAVIANSENICIIRLLIQYDIYAPTYYYISSYWTSSKNENVKFFAGTDTLYFEFNSKTSHKFTRIELFSFFYTIIVPKNSAIYLKLEQVIIPQKIMYGTSYPTITVMQNNYISLFSTPGYGTSKGNSRLEYICYCFPLKKMKFTTIYYQMNAYDNFQFTFKNVSTPVIQNGGIYIFDHHNDYNLTSLIECITMEFTSRKLIENEKNGIVFLVETIEDKNENDYNID